jgi:hypothetical protein
MSAKKRGLIFKENSTKNLNKIKQSIGGYLVKLDRNKQILNQSINGYKVW